MEADDGHVGFVDVFGIDKGLDRLGMDAGNEILRLRQHARPRGAIGQASALL